MATYEATQSRNNGCIVVVCVAVLFSGALLTAIGAVLPSVDTHVDAVDLPKERYDDHADIKHGDDAQIAREWVATNGGDHCKWSCPDGNDRYVCRTDTGKWAIVVINAVTNVEVTAFLTDSQGYAQTCVEGGTNPWRYTHP